METNSLTSTIQRTLTILELFLSEQRPLTAQEIVQQTGISRSTVFSMLKVLLDLEYLEQRQNRGPYSAGWRFSAWKGVSTPSYQSLINAFQQESQVHSFDETLALAVLSPQGIVVLAQVESPAEIRAVYPESKVLPQDSAAAALLASHIAPDVREKGYTLFEKVESLEIALPICPDGMNPTAALLLKAPAFRTSKDRLVETTLDSLRSIAARLSYRLGAFTYSPYQTGASSTLHPKESLSVQQMDHFLQGPWTARLACIRPDGNPHVIPVWQEWDGEHFYILAWQGSQWADYVMKNPQVSLTIDEPWPPLRRVVCSGQVKAVVTTDPEKRNTLISRLAQRYLGNNAPMLFQHQIENIFQISPVNLRGWMGIPTAGNEK